ncbi:class I SAM-dependent methyltransferase [Algicola sagamiensis]|uniref:DNA methyltransferase n=1 Tax=Algicola sagamiensis TaxID=163869 RepID=UPI00035CB859|nr:DNA methyltransferase [Algicola sagamiensis]
MSRTTGKTQPREFYPTPEDTVKALLKELTFKEGDTFLEPCKGDGAIYDQIPLPGHQKRWAEIHEGVDYLNTPFEKADVIITNPPFSLAKEFLWKSKSELAYGGTMIYLLKLDYLGTKQRVSFWEEFGVPQKLKVITPRPRFVTINGRSNDSCEYAWYVWDYGNRLAECPFISHLRAA